MSEGVVRNIGILSPLILSFSLVSTTVGAEGFSISFDQTESQNRTENQAREYVDVHAVLLADFSTSMSDEELKRARDGIFAYLVSDDAVQDYKVGIKKAVTVIYFAQNNIASPTKIIGSVEDAKDFMSSYYERLDIQGADIISFSPGVFLEDGTNVVQAMAAVEGVFGREEDIGIYSERKEVVLVGDQLFEGQQKRARFVSDEITEKYGARFCAVAVHEEGTDAPDYSYIVTENPKTIFNKKGYSVPVKSCAVKYATQPEKVMIAVAQSLAMVRN